MATFGGGISHNYQKKAVKRLQYARDVIEDQFGMSYDQFQEALTSFQEGFPGVMDEITAMGDNSRQGAYDEYQQRVGEGGQNLVSRGLGNTTVRSNFESGESSRYMRNLADINEGLAGMRSGVMLQGLGMQSQLMQQLGGVNERFAGAYGNITQGMAQVDISGGEQSSGLGFQDLVAAGAAIYTGGASLAFTGVPGTNTVEGAPGFHTN